MRKWEDMKNRRLINFKIAKFYQDEKYVPKKDTIKYFSDNDSLNFVELSKLLLENSNEAEIIDVLASFKYSDYLCCYQKLLHVFLHCAEVVKAAKTKLEKLHLKWLGSNYKYLEKCFDKMGTTTAAVEQVLLLTAILENALGNVYYTHSKGRTPPHLLKDLLSSWELRAVFGVEAIVFLKILLGTPRSINLRNIVWHGFPRPHEIPPYYVAVLLLTLHTLGITLETQQFTLQQRPQIQNFTSCIKKLEPNLQIQTFSTETQQALSTCHWLSEQHKVYWQELLRYYNNQQYYNFVILILPQIELLLRLIYGRANNFDITAKLDEYYITIDTILEANVPATANTGIQKNKLLLGEANISMGTLHYLYDLFAAPCGPRLRDKVSHGEVSMAAINNSGLCRILLHFALDLLISNEQRSPLENYESQFHLNSLTKAALHQAAVEIQLFIKQHFQDEVHPQENSFAIIGFSLPMGKVNIFQRPKNEPELMNVTLKIAQLLVQTCANYETSLQERLTLLGQHELHSRRRRTLEKLLQTLPQIFAVQCEILNCLQFIFLKSQTEIGDTFLDSIKLDKLLRFLKHVLKISENLLKYSHKDSNEWIKALDLCKKFNDCYDRIFPFKDEINKLSSNKRSDKHQL